MSRNLPAKSPRRDHEVGSGPLHGDHDPEAVTDEKVVGKLRDGLYALTRSAVDIWGGPMALASYWRCAFSNVSTRLNRREVNGSTQYAFLDFLAIALSQPSAAGVATEEWHNLLDEQALSCEEGRAALTRVLVKLCDRLGFEPPKKRRVKTEAEKFAALVEELRGAGPLGESAIRRAAATIGADPAEYGL